MLRGLFVTGTDTGVGKTVVSSALVGLARGTGVRYWKPIQTGIEGDDDTATVRHLSECAPGEVLDNGDRLHRHVSPHLAAASAGVRIDPAALVTILKEEDAETSWIVEGAGGALVPVNEGSLVVDIMVSLGLPVLVVARTSLGTINHTLLTLEALRARSLPVAGVVMVGVPNRDNRFAIERYGRVPAIAELPLLRPLTASALHAAAVQGGLEQFSPARR